MPAYAISAEDLVNPETPQMDLTYDFDSDFDWDVEAVANRLARAEHDEPPLSDQFFRPFCGGVVFHQNLDVIGFYVGSFEQQTFLDQLAGRTGTEYHIIRLRPKKAERTR